MYGFGMDCSLQKTHVEKKRIHYGKDFPEIMTAFAFYGFIWAQHITSRPRTITKTEKMNYFYEEHFDWLFACISVSLSLSRPQWQGQYKNRSLLSVYLQYFRYCIFIAINLLAY